MIFQRFDMDTTQSGQKARRHDLRVGKNIFELSYSPSGLRSITGGLVSLATSVAREEELRGYLVVVDPKVTERRLKQEWARILEPLRVDVRERLHLVTVAGDRVEGLPGDATEEIRRRLNILASEQVQAGRVRLLPKSSYHEILKILIYRWLRKDGPRSAKDIAADAGCTYPTLSIALTRLGGLINRGPKRSVALSRFPMNEWSELVSLSDRVRSTMRFADRSGQPRGIDSLISRLQNLRLSNVAVGGVHGAQFHYSDLDLVGNPQLVLSVHCAARNADLRFVERLDPALQHIRSPQEPSHLILHFIRRSEPYFVSKHDGLNISDPVECLLDLHEARLEPQAMSLLNHLTRTTPISHG
jgi:hypothetical protein